MVRRLALSLTLLAAFAATEARAQGCDTSIDVVNQSGVQIDELYFNPSSNSSWGRDRLGENVLTSGRAIGFRPGRGGNYDFKVVWSGGNEAEIRGVDICTISKVVATRGRLRAE